MKTLVIGASGYCGQPIVEHLSYKGYHVRAFDLHIRPIPGYSKVKFIQGDVTQFTDVVGAAKGCDAIVLSFLHNVKRPDYSEDIITEFRINVGGTVTTLEAARQLQIPQVVILGSGRVVWDYFADGTQLRKGNLPKVDETTPLNFSDHYGLSKKLQEEIAQFYAENHIPSIIIFRPWWVVDGRGGVNRYGQKLEDDPIPLSPAGMVDRYDLADAVYLALEQPQTQFKIFFPASGPESDRYFDTEPLRKSLGWDPMHDFHQLTTMKKETLND